MSGGHDDDHGHGGASGHGPAAGHEEGPAEFPPVPPDRWISPAKTDFEQPFPGSGLLWPPFWLAVALALWAATSAWPGRMGEHHPEGGPEHEAPAER